MIRTRTETWEAREWTMVGGLPKSFPDGWFRVAFAEDLAAGDVVPMRYFGRDLVLYVSTTGIPRVLDAHCPHLGAHLGHGGVVKGETLRQMEQDIPIWENKCFRGQPVLCDGDGPIERLRAEDANNFRSLP